MTGFNPLTLAGAMNDTSAPARADNLAALNASLSAHQCIEYPEGVLHLPASPNVVINGKTILGADKRATSIQADGDIFLVNGPGGNSGFRLGHFSVRNDGGTKGTLLRVYRANPLENAYMHDMVWGESIQHIYQYGKVESPTPAAPGPGPYTLQGGMLVGWKIDRCIFEFGQVRSRFIPCASGYNERASETKYSGKGLQLGDNGGSILGVSIDGASIFEALGGDAIIVCAEGAHVDGVLVNAYFENNTGYDLYRLTKTAHHINGVSLSNCVFGSPAGGSKSVRTAVSAGGGGTIAALNNYGSVSLALPIS